MFLRNFQRLKKNKIPDTQARKKSTRQMTQTDDINRRHKNGCNPRQTRTPAYNSVQAP
jgi:hypothetical protein